MTAAEKRRRRAEERLWDNQLFYLQGLVDAREALQKNDGIGSSAEAVAAVNKLVKLHMRKTKRPAVRTEG